MQGKLYASFSIQGAPNLTYDRLFSTNIRFQSEISKIKRKKKARSEPIDKDDAQQTDNGRHIYTGSKFWTVLSRTTTPLVHPFDPPIPFTGTFFDFV